MYILLDNTEKGRVVFYSKVNTKWVHDVYGGKTGGDMLVSLDLLLKKNKKTKKDIKGLAVLLPGGTFTSARLATTFVNTLSFALGLPVVGVDKIDFKALEEKFKKAKTCRLISPVYSAEANVGKANSQ